MNKYILIDAMKDIVSKTSVILAVFIALASAHPWFLWSYSGVSILLLALFLVLRTLLLKLRFSMKYSIPLYFTIILWCYLYVTHAPGFSDVFSTIFTRLLPLIAVLLLSLDEKKKVIVYLTNILSTILLISLIFFLAWTFGVSLPNSMLENSLDSFYPVFSNYYAFIVIADLGIFTRFQSVFTEPGHLGMIISLLLYINKYDLRKWQCWVMLISLLWSLSLAAYVLLVIGLFLYICANSENFIKLVFRILVVFTIIVSIGVYYYSTNSDSVVSTLIFSRLEFDGEHGIAGNNRNDYDFKKYYESFEERSEYYWGIGINGFSKLSFSGGNSSYKIFIVQYGLIGILILAVYGISIIMASPSRLYWGLFFLYCISFMQRPYALWEIESYPFICFAGCINSFAHRNC